MSHENGNDPRPEDKTKKQDKEKTPTNADDLDVCTSDPAWAEHARPNNEGPDPCDDGRGIEFEKE